MRKNIIASILLVSTFGNAAAALPTGATPFDVNIPSLCGGPTLGLVGLHWKTHTSEYDYALTYPTLVNGAPLIEQGNYHNVNPDSRWNFKVNFGYIFPCGGNDLTFSYLNYHQRTNDSINLNPSSIAFILPTFSNEWPSTSTLIISDPTIGAIVIGFTTNPNLAIAKTTINHDAFDFDYAQRLNGGSQARIKYYGGLRYVTLRNSFETIYNYSSSNLPISISELGEDILIVNKVVDFTEVIKQTSNYEGLGPHFGFNVNYYLCWGFGLVADFSTSLLAGKTSTRLEDTFTRSLDAIVLASDLAAIATGTVFSQLTSDQKNVNLANQQRIVPNLDARVGLDWSYQYCKRSHSKLTIEAGYMVSHYFNIIDRISEIAVDQPESRTTHSINEHFEGLYFGFQIDI